MIRVKKELVELNTIEGFVCNICDGDIKPFGPDARDAEYAVIEAYWGFGAKIFDDGEKHEAHICEGCYHKHIYPLLTVDPVTRKPSYVDYHTILAPDEDSYYGE